MDLMSKIIPVSCSFDGTKGTSFTVHSLVFTLLGFCLWQSVNLHGCVKKCESCEGVQLTF